MVAQYFKRKRETVEVIVLLTSQDVLKMMSTSTIDIMRGVFFTVPHRFQYQHEKKIAQPRSKIFWKKWLELLLFFYFWYWKLGRLLPYHTSDNIMILIINAWTPGGSSQWQWSWCGSHVPIPKRRYQGCRVEVSCQHLRWKPKLKDLLVEEEKLETSGYEDL